LSSRSSLRNSARVLEHDDEHNGHRANGRGGGSGGGPKGEDFAAVVLKLADKEARCTELEEQVRVLAERLEKLLGE
jgi:uncharacterized spore protein YtfJ